MKNTFLFIVALSLLACNNAEKNTNATLPTTPNGLADIQSGTVNNGIDSSGQALNPAHGAPGHDCAIPVGAPLKSASVKTATDTAIKSVVAPQVAKPKTNPAHVCHFTTVLWQ